MSLEGFRTRILPQGEMWLQRFDLWPLSRGATGYGPSRLFYLDVVLYPDEYIPYLCDVILHQVFVEGVCDLQPTDEGGCSYVLVTIVY